MREQRRARRIAMSPEELDAYLATARTCRVATVGRDGAPHVSPLWFVWDGRALWLNSIVKSQRWTNFLRDPRVSVVVDGGDGYLDLHGVELIGEVEPVGEAPRVAEPNPDLGETERLWGDKYAGGTFVPDGRHAWVRLVPDKIVSWDFRKLPTG
jgi:PPOX class probable F420-dependent enzyme